MIVSNRSPFLTVPERFRPFYDRFMSDFDRFMIENAHKTLGNGQERSGTVNARERS
jgi:hypothetical protein